MGGPGVGVGVFKRLSEQTGWGKTADLGGYSIYVVVVFFREAQQLCPAAPTPTSLNRTF